MNSLNHQIIKNNVFIYNLPYRLSREDIVEYFSTHAGDILKITFPSNTLKPGSNSGKCYIKFKDALSVSNAIKLNGQCILGQPIFIIDASNSIKKDNSFYENYEIPRRRFQTIRRQKMGNIYDFDEKSGRFKGGYLLSDDFRDYCLDSKSSRPVSHETRSTITNRLGSSFLPSSILS